MMMLNTPTSTKKGAVKGGLRRKEEDVPGLDYMERLTALGPREGESYLAFKMRLASVEESRKQIMIMARRHKSDAMKVCLALGIDRHNLGAYLRKAGLSFESFYAFKELKEADVDTELSEDNAEEQEEQNDVE